MSREQDRTSHYQEGSLTLPGTIMLGTGVMIYAGIFALTGQMAQMTGVLFPLSFLAAAVIISFSAYSYIKISNTWPSAEGIGMYLHKAYDNRLPTAFNALLMCFSMVIAIVVVIPVWRICQRTGGSGWMGALILIPFVNLLLLYSLAFSKWPGNRGAGE